ncbi:hypothetical protein ABH14_03070 [Brevibacillus brevis]|nr:hypothetical protein [Brevibacillus brevis]
MKINIETTPYLFICSIPVGVEVFQKGMGEWRVVGARVQQVWEKSRDNSVTMWSASIKAFYCSILNINEGP